MWSSSLLIDGYSKLMILVKTSNITIKDANRTMENL